MQSHPGCAGERDSTSLGKADEGQDAGHFFCLLPGKLSKHRGVFSQGGPGLIVRPGLAAAAIGQGQGTADARLVPGAGAELLRLLPGEDADAQNGHGIAVLLAVELLEALPHDPGTALGQLAEDSGRLPAPPLQLGQGGLLLHRETVAMLLEHRKAAPEKIIRPIFEDSEGSPVLFPAWAFPELQNLPEGRGGGIVIHNHPDALCRVSVSDPFELADADTPEMLETLRGLCHDQATE